MRSRVARAAAAVVLALLAGAGAATAQGVQTGTLRGTVMDAQGGVLPGAVVTISSPALQGSRETVTDTQGGYVFRLLPPGDYKVTVTMQGFSPVEQTLAVPLGSPVERNVTVGLASLTAEVQVVGTAAAPLTSPTVGLNIRQEEVEALATSRTLYGISTLSPGLNTNTPNSGQLSINGAFAFDNIFMINGVDVNDNLFGSPQNLFIEDAIQETEVLTSGISAEYGRFSGGVVNAVTKSGGNSFSGSYRLNLTNPAWIAETPFEESSGVSHESTLNDTHEATFGGPIMKDRLWFFSAGRLAKLTVPETLPESGIGITQVDDNKRGEIKLTATVHANQTIQGGYLNNSRSVTNSSGLFDYIIDPHSLVTPKTPNNYYFTNYRGVLRSNLLAEAQYSQRKFRFEDDGGTSPDIIDSPFSALSLDAVYNAPYFDATDQESRNNQQFTGSLTYFLARGGQHELKGGYEFFRSQNKGGNSQSSTDYVFDADYVTDASGAPALDANGRLIPIFAPGETRLEHWMAVRGATLNVDNHSFYAQDHWRINRRFSADLGVRYEKVRSKATGNIIGVDTDTIVPRLALGYDVTGDGSQMFHVTYGHYSGRYNEAQIGANSNVANPDETVAIYSGPAGTGRSYAPGLDVANYDVVFGSFPTQNVFVEAGLSSPITRELTASYGANFLGGKGYAEGTYVWRRMANFIEDFIELSNGTTDVVKDGIDAGTFTNIEYRNTSDEVQRRYQAAILQARYNLTRHLVLNGNWTITFKNEGNYEGEAQNQPGAVSLIGDYPEAFSEARNFPIGRLASFQRHRARLWAIWSTDTTRWGATSVSGLVRIESGQSYSLRATGQPLSDIQEDLLAAYPDAPGSQTIYFGERGSESFKGYAALDVSVNYAVPVLRSLRPFVKFDAFNVLNNDKLISWNTTVTPDPASPLDSLGLPTGYIKGTRFGQATSNNNFPISTLSPGLRSFRVSLGLRF